MNKTSLNNGELEINFGDNPALLQAIFLNESAKVCADGMQTVVVRNPLAVSDPAMLTIVSETKFHEDKVEYKISDNSGKYFANIIAETSGAGIKFKMKVSAPAPIWLVEWRLSGFNFDEVLVPALGGQSLNKSMPNGDTLSYKYPFWWNAQFAIGKIEDGGLMFSIRDKNPSLKLLRVGKENNSFTISLGVEAEAPLNSNTLETEWFIHSFNGDWKNGVDDYRTWLEQNFDVKPFEKHPHFPEWMNKINFVLELWGARKGIYPSHTFSQMIDRLHQWKEMHNPENTLLYLPGFAENGIDSHAPDYNPSKQCGGELEFKKLIDEAHKLGFKVMIHTNVLAMTYTHPLYKRFKKYQVIDCFEREQGWAMDIDGDWLTEPYFAYINPGEKEWGKLMQKKIGEIIEQFSVDGVFLDQTLLAFNVNRGPNFMRGMKEHIQHLQNSFPQILFAGEGLHELVLEALPAAQIHGIDSIAEVHGMDGHLPWRKAHPVSTYLFGKYTRYMAHLLTKHPSHQMFAAQEAAYTQLGVIPALCLYNYEQEMDLPEVKEMIERAKKIKTFSGIVDEKN